MDPLQSVRARIPDFPGYGDDLSRRRSDSFIRSYVGEALANAEARLGALDPELQGRLGELLLRAGFADSQSFAVHNGSKDGTQAFADAEQAVVVEDDAALALADRAATVDAAALGSYLDELSALFDRRAATMRAAARSSTP
jgi:hypothetical protein